MKQKSGKAHCHRPSLCSRRQVTRFFKFLNCWQDIWIQLCIHFSYYLPVKGKLKNDSFAEENILYFSRLC